MPVQKTTKDGKLNIQHGKIVAGMCFEMLTVIKSTDRRTKSREIVWKCLCDCGRETYVNTSNLWKGQKSCGCIRGAENRMKKCTDCGITQLSTNFGLHNSRRREKCRPCHSAYNQRNNVYKDQKRTIRLHAKYLLNASRVRAKKKNWQHTLDMDWVRDRLIVGVCEVTSIKFINKSSMWAPSIDRIDNEIGYLKSNCRLVVRSFNQMKGCGTDADVFKLATIIITVMGE